MRSVLTLVTPPAVEPVTLAEAKAWARIDGTDDDAVLTALIAAARGAAEEFLRRSLIAQTWRLTLDQTYSRSYDDLPEGIYDLPITALYGGLPQSLALPKGPVSAVTSVTTYDLSNVSSVYAASNYRVDAAGGRFLLNYGAVWPSSVRPDGGTEILYVAGYGAAPASVPQPIRTGILIHVASLFEQRGLCEDAMALPPGTEQLYRPYRIVGDRRG